MTLTFSTGRFSEVFEVHVCAKFHPASLAVHDLSWWQRKRQKLSYDAENSTAVATADSSDNSPLCKYHKSCVWLFMGNPSL